MSQSDYSAAIADFTASMERSYDVALNLQHRGACKLFLGDQPGAQADFKQANELTQNPGMLFFFRAVLRQVEGDFEGIGLYGGHPARSKAGERSPKAGGVQSVPSIATTTIGSWQGP